jgi:hypothetical protein
VRIEQQGNGEARRNFVFFLARGDLKARISYGKVNEAAFDWRLGIVELVSKMVLCNRRKRKRVAG